MLLFARGSSGTGTRPAYLREIASGCIKVSIDARDFQWLERNIEPTGANRSRMLFDGRMLCFHCKFIFFSIRRMRNNFFFLLSHTFSQLFLIYIFIHIKKKKSISLSFLDRKRKDHKCDIFPQRFPYPQSSFYFYFFFSSQYRNISINHRSIQNHRPPFPVLEHDETRLISSRRNPFPCKRAKRSISLPVTYVRVP